MKIKCRNKRCKSHEIAKPLFTITVHVDENRQVLSNLNKRPPQYFKCNHCGDLGILVK